MESRELIDKLNVNYTSLNMVYPINKVKFFENYFKGVDLQYDNIINVIQKSKDYCIKTVQEKNKIFIIKRDLRLYINDLKTKKDV